MKRLTAFFVLFLTALCFALTASAADYAVNFNANVLEISMTAESDCALWVAAYDASGKMTRAESMAISESQSITLNFEIIPEGGYAKAFLLNAETFAPLCACGDTRNDNAPVYTEDVYAILYDDGTLVFQRGDEERMGWAIDKYAVDMQGSYYSFVGGVTTPWLNDERIKRVYFADKIQPKSTAYWFSGCRGLVEILNAENLDTTQVTDMQGMFRDCSSLTELDLSAFDTANVTDMMGIFVGCSALTTIYASDKFVTTQVIVGGDMGDMMFWNCRSLIGGNGTKCDGNNPNSIGYARIDGGEENPGYFTAK